MRALFDLGPSLWTSGFYSVQLLSHKLLRYFVPVYLILLLASNIWLSLTGLAAAWDILLALQITFYGAAILGAAARSSSARRSRLLTVPYYFCLVNTAALLALLSVSRGVRAAGWSPRGGLEPRPTGRTLGAAYASRRNRWEDTTMEKLTDFIEALRAGWWALPVVVAVALGSVAYLTAGDAPPVYRTTATLAAVPHPSIGDEIQVLRSVEVLERRTMVSTLSRIPASGSARRKAADRLGTPLTDLRNYVVRTSIVPGTHLIRVSVEGPDPEVSAGLANAVAAVAEDEASAYYRVFALKVLDEAGVPGRSVGRGEGRAYAVAGLLGLFLGVGAAFGVGVLRANPGLETRPDAHAGRGHPKPAP
jgi:capsular polysaccharide biosynthesis protein